MQWEAELRGFTQTFIDQREDLHKELMMFASLEMRQANKTLVSIDSRTSSLDLKLDLLRPLEERKLLEEIEARGGLNVVREDKNLQLKVQQLSESLERQKETRLFIHVSSAVQEAVERGQTRAMEEILLQFAKFSQEGELARMIEDRVSTVLKSILSEVMFIFHPSAGLSQVLV